MALNDDFKTSVDDVVVAVLGTDSIYEKILKKFDSLYADMGMTAQERASAIAEVSAQLAISASSSAVNAGVELAKSAPLVAAQVSEINAKIELVDQQVLAEQLKNGGLSYTYTYNDDGTIATKTLATGSAKSIYELQQEREEITIEEVRTKIAHADQQVLAEKLKNGGLSYTYTYNDDGTIATKTLATGSAKSIYELQQEREKSAVDLNVRQKVAFNDKLLVEVEKALSGVAQMEATTGTTQTGTLLNLNKSINFVLKAAGKTESDYYPTVAT